MSRLGTEEEDRGDSQSKIFIDKIGRVFIETRGEQDDSKRFVSRHAASRGEEDGRQE